MCPACIATISVIVAGAGFTARILALCVGKLKGIVEPMGFLARDKTKGDLR
jgi:hypothetical protein